MTDDSNTVCAFWGFILGQKLQIFSENLLNSSVLNHQIPLFAPKGNFKNKIFWKLMNNATKWAMFALWPIRRYGDILGQNHNILLKNRRILEKMCNHFIFTSILKPCKSSYDKRHRLSFLMSQTWYVYYIGHFGAKTADFWRKFVKLLPINSSFLITNNPCVP
jgi:hypothetical protein